MRNLFGFGDDPFVDAAVVAIGLLLGVGLLTGFGMGLGVAIFV